MPGRIRYDNLKAAVVRVLRGRDRIESERFVALRSHYGFDSFFCQPGEAGAHEKGGVEGEVGRFRRRHLVPVPHVASMAELGYVQLDARGSELLFQIPTEREEKASVALASNLPVSEWGTVIPDPRLVAAIVDRVTFNARIIETGTDSFRLRATKTRARRKPA